MRTTLPNRRAVLAAAPLAALLPIPAALGAGAPPSACRLRQPGPPLATAVDPPRTARPDAASRFGAGRLVTLYDQTTWGEGPVWWPRERTLVWSDVVGRRVLGWREDGAVDVLVDATPFINGNGVDRDGSLIHCEQGRRAISRSDGEGRQTVLTTTADGQRLNAPNDLVVTADGSIWFSDPTFGLENPKQGCPAPSDSGRMSICRLAPGARDATRMADMVQPNGLGFSPDGRTFYASQTPEDGRGEVAIFAFDWNGTRLGGRRTFARVATGIPDGFAVDRHGWIWSSSGSGIEVFDPTGASVGVVPTPHLCSNCAFDGEERRLFITGGDNLWMLALDS